MNSPPGQTEFSREHGCTEDEWLRWLPGAVRDNAWTLMRPGKARVVLASGGTLTLRWHGLPQRRLGQTLMPRLSVNYLFDGVGDAEREEFMRYFDLYLQRGGG